MTMKGSYQGTNIYVTNPYSNTGFCIDSVVVNDALFDGNYGSGALEIELNSRYKTGDSLDIEIYHKPDCKPTILNVPSKVNQKIAITNANISSDCVLTYEVQAEYLVNFKIEQYRWNKWINVPDLDTITSSGYFEFNLSQNLHSGENTFRVCAYDINGKKNCSNRLTFSSTTSKEKLQYIKEENRIVFTSPSRYELYDVYGNLVKIGNGTEVDLSSIKKGVYYLNFGNRNEKIKIRNQK